MTKIYQYILHEIVKQRLKKEVVGKQFEVEKRKVKIDISRLIKDSFLILAGVFSASLGLKGFLLPNSFIDGGVTGISLITRELTNISFPILLVGINLPFLLLAFTAIGRQFALKSIVAVVILAVAVHFMPSFTVTDDKLLIAVFGGFFLGAGIGLAIRGGSVIDGTEVLAVYISRKLPLTIGDVILIFNVIIFSFAAYVFSVEIAMYAMLTYMSAAKTVDFVVTGLEEFVGVTIISEKSDEIRLAIIENLGRGCTVYLGKKGFAKRGEPLKKTDIVYTLLTRLELSKLQNEVDKIDSEAFIIMHSIKDAKGGMIKKRPLKN